MINRPTAGFKAAAILGLALTALPLVGCNETTEAANNGNSVDSSQQNSELLPGGIKTLTATESKMNENRCDQNIEKSDDPSAHIESIYFYGFDEANKALRKKVYLNSGELIGKTDQQVLEKLAEDNHIVLPDDPELIDPLLAFIARFRQHCIDTVPNYARGFEEPTADSQEPEAAEASPEAAP